MQVPGQLWFADRVLLYSTIRRHKPQTVFEVGTWLGGGSTYFIAQALHDNGSGVLQTIESDPDTYAHAVDNYKRYLPHLLPHVIFHRGLSMDVYPAILASQGAADAVFLDGAAEPVQTLEEFRMFQPSLRHLFMGHDWYGDKMSALRPIIENSHEWIVERVIQPPRSLGFVVAVRAGQRW